MILIFADNGTDDCDVYILNNLSDDLVWVNVYLRSRPIFVYNLFEACLICLFGELISV